MHSLSTVEAAARTGVTYRMLDYWVRVGVITPIVEAKGSGTSRRFAPGQLPILRLLAKVREFGAPQDTLAGLSRHARLLDPPAWGQRVLVTFDGVILPRWSDVDGYLVDLASCVRPDELPERTLASV